MESFFANLASAAVVASAGGIALLAYKHPKGFKRLSALLSRLMSLGGIFLCGWLLALEFSKMAMDRSLAPTQAEAAKAILATRAPALWVVIALLAFSLFITILEFLPLIIDDESEKEADSN